MLLPLSFRKMITFFQNSRVNVFCKKKKDDKLSC